MSTPPGGKKSFQAPTGTRDFYPIELARRRFIEDKWRTVSIRHGFDEIDGPLLEHSDLYAVKSGQGILNELFQTFSGKDPEQAKLAGEGRAPYALRPEFTPTLARMYAARAGQLPKPCKWFWQQNCYRAERPQRGRLREFMQWNCDILGGGGAEGAETTEFDAEIIAVCVDALASFGLKREDLKVQINDRQAVSSVIASCGGAGKEQETLVVLDKRSKLKPEEFARQIVELGVDLAKFDAQVATFKCDRVGASPTFASLGGHLGAMGIEEWCEINPSIARGLAYYTGMVFEVIVDGERAVAGGGRYDNLIELFGGPPTPAVGFGMGDVVLSLVLQDKKLMPTDREIAQALGLRPDVFVISNGTPEADTLVAKYLGELRRKGMHARRTYKSTKNIGKLLKEASDAGSRYAMIIEGPSEVTLKDLDTNEQHKGAYSEMVSMIKPS